MGFQGWAIFMDCDMLCRADISDLWALRDERFAVMCVQHDHQPTEASKFLGETQSAYPKKNWSSLMLLNCSRCQALTPEYVNSASGLDLHRFHWLDGDHQIGALPNRWNHLVGVQEPASEEAALLHWTLGGPGFASSAAWAGLSRPNGLAPVMTPWPCGTNESPHHRGCHSSAAGIKRLPRKLLADVGGKPLLQRVLERCLELNTQPLLCSAPIAKNSATRPANGPCRDLCLC